MTSLESQLKTLSASTSSVSSSSSLGSLSTSSSKGSLSSGLSFTDIYGHSQCADINWPGPSVDMVDLHRRVERLLRPNGEPVSPQPSLSPRSSLSSVSPPVSPQLHKLSPKMNYTFENSPVIYENTTDAAHVFDNTLSNNPNAMNSYNYNDGDPLYENIGNSETLCHKNVYSEF